MKKRCMTCLQVGPHLRTCDDPHFLDHVVFGPPVVPGPAWNGPTRVLYVVTPRCADTGATKVLQMPAETRTRRRRAPRWAVTLVTLGVPLTVLGLFRHEVALRIWEMIPR